MNASKSTEGGHDSWDEISVVLNRHKLTAEHPCPQEIPGMSQPAKEATFFQLRATDRGQMLVLLDGRRLLINPSYVTIAVFWYSSAPIEISEGDGGAL